MSNMKKPDNKPMIAYVVIVIVAMLLINALLVPAINSRQVQDVAYSKFLDMLDEKQIQKAQVVSDEYIIFQDQDGNLYKTTQMNDPDLVSKMHEQGVIFEKDLNETNPVVAFLVSWVLPLVIFYLIGLALSRSMMKRIGGDGAGGPMMSFGKSNAKVYVPSTTSIKFKDVAGEEEAKQLLQELVSYLKNPQKYVDIGAHCPKGALLVGPPGTGKTLLAKAVAGEAGVPFFSIAGSEFVEMFVGMGASKVRDLFAQAEKNAPCIVFIDEIDTIGKKRDGASSIGGNDEREQTLNQLLTEMDGFDGSKGVIILAATNRPEVLDPALLRPGRFDRRIPVELPDLQGRIDILKVHAKKVRMADNIDFGAIAKTAAGTSGADLANIVNEAALRAVRMGRKYVIQQDLQESIEVVIAGYQKKSRVLSTKEKLIVAYHEIGHAMVAAYQTNSAPVQKITIIPRTNGALGYTLQVDEGDKFLLSKEEMLSRIATFTGGRCAEELIFHSITTGASNDIEQATKFARAMITQYGMDDDFDMVAMSTTSNMYLGGDQSLACSPDTATRIDEATVRIVKEQHAKAYKILENHKSKLHQLAKFLYENETITGEQFMEILNQDEKKLETTADSADTGALPSGTTSETTAQ
ncbi:MAG: ATP-dependent zinc metalloprotease FtsH [Lachnospiraceae bacterium]|nr:ATP-dependent zinc metalloprotease FtsH [Lachnospiraceae bacterium]